MDDDLGMSGEDGGCADYIAYNKANRAGLRNFGPSPNDPRIES
jgi:hypothetical protein